jgi:hypothetical protein
MHLTVFSLTDEEQKHRRKKRNKEEIDNYHLICKCYGEINSISV